MDLLSRAAMNCPACHHRVEPLDGSTWVIAWYSCSQCGNFWSARLRGGVPVPESEDRDRYPNLTRLLLEIDPSAE